MSVLETEARMKAEAILIQTYPDEFEEIHNTVRTKKGLDLVCVQRVVVKYVTPAEAITLVRHGWERVKDAP